MSGAQTQQEALLELVEQAMMSGFMQIMSNKAKIMGAYSGSTDQSGGDLLRVALDDFPASFLEIRRDLVDAVFEAAG